MSNIDAMPMPPTLGSRDRLVATYILAAVSWAAVIVLMLVEAARRDLPAPIVAVAAVGAATIATAAGLMHVRYADRTNTARDHLMHHEEVHALRGEIARLQEGMTAGFSAMVAARMGTVVHLDDPQRVERTLGLKGRGEKSMYWGIYTDVLSDLSGLGDDGDSPREPAQ